MLSWLKSTPAGSSSEGAQLVPAATQQQQPVASTSSQPVANAVELAPPAPPPPSTLPRQTPPPPRPTRKEVNPNAPYVIFACAGTAVAVGVLLGVRRVTSLRTKTMELSAAAAAAEAAEAGGQVASGPIVSGARPGRTASILSKGSLSGIKTTASQQPSRGNPFQAAAAAVKGPEAALAGGPSSKPLSAATASLLRKPAPGPAAVVSGRQPPLFPPSQARPTAPSTSPASESPNAAAAASAASAPKATLRSLIKEGRKKDADEHEELPPMTTAVMLRAAGAFAMATGLAVFLVGGPFVATCWWLGVEEPADFTPMFRRKIVTIFPSLEEGLLREEAEAAAAAADVASDSSSSSSQISFTVPDFLRRSPTDAAAPAEATPSAYIPSILHQGAAPEGEEEHGVYAWFEGVKEEFEKDRLAEAAQRAEDARFYREWEEKMRKEGR